MTGSGRGAEQGHGNRRWVPPDLEAQCYKTVSAAFHLNNKETKCELKVNLKNETLPFCSEQIPWSNVGQVAHVSPTFARSWHHASFSWGGFLAPLGVLEQQHCKQPPLPWCIQPQSTALLSGAAVLTSALSFPPSTMPCELWLDACLLHQQTTFQSSQASNLQVSNLLKPAELRRNGATLSLTRRAMELRHLFQSGLTRPSSADARRLKSRQPFVPVAQQLISSSDNNKIHAAHWVDHQWNAEWADNPTRLCIFIPDTGTQPPGPTLPRRSWVRLNRLGTGVGRFRSSLYKWGMASSAAQKNKPSTMLVQSIDLLMDCTAWRFWTMRQATGCSTPAPRSSAAKQWLEQLAQKKRNQPTPSL